MDSPGGLPNGVVNGVANGQGGGDAHVPQSGQAINQVPPQPANSACGEQASIPLLCHVCDQKPTFSDLSHLLTHLNSKTHLAKKHQMKLEALSDPDARARLDAFKKWKKQHNIINLLADRYAKKKRNGAAHALNHSVQQLRGSSVSSSRGSRAIMQVSFRCLLLFMSFSTFLALALRFL